MQRIEDLKYSLFLGCVIPNRYPMIEKATRSLMKEMGVQLMEIESASCCPAPGVFKSIDRALWLTMAARNLVLAERNKTEVLTLCNLCYSTLIEVEQKLRKDPELKAKINDILNKMGYNYAGACRVRHIVDILYFDVGLYQLNALVKRKLNWKVAVHYGCQLLKPTDLRPFGGECEKPRFFDEIVEITGCTSVDYEFKMQCCGAGGGVRTSMKKASLEFLIDKLRNIRRAGADCIVTACPFCYLQFDLGQLESRILLKKDEEPFEIPVLYITQLIGLALGLDLKDLGLIKPKTLAGITPFVSHEILLKTLDNNL